jgi:hypothetical protein
LALRLYAPALSSCAKRDPEWLAGAGNVVMIALKGLPVTAGSGEAPLPCRPEPPPLQWPQQ